MVETSLKLHTDKVKYWQDEFPNWFLRNLYGFFIEMRGLASESWQRFEKI